MRPNAPKIAYFVYDEMRRTSHRMSVEKMYEDRFGKFPLSNITSYLIGGNVIAYCLGMLYPQAAGSFGLSAHAVLSGEWWRLLTVLFVPFGASPIWVAFSWYLAYLFGTALEHVWGAFRYTLYVTIAYMATVILVFLYPNEVFSNGYIYASTFLAFAYLVPDFTLNIFFIIPVKIKWFAWLAWVGMIGALWSGDWPSRVQTILAVSNFCIFFGSDIYLRLSDSLRHGSGKIGTAMKPQQSYMRCVVCKKTEHDRKIFYYCHDCIPERCYCEDHIKGHAHVGQSN